MLLANHPALSTLALHTLPPGMGGGVSPEKSLTLRYPQVAGCDARALEVVNSGHPSPLPSCTPLPPPLPQTGPSATSSRKSSQWLQVEPSASSSQLCNSSRTAAPTLMKFPQSWGKSSVSVPSTALHLGAGHRTRRMKLQEKLPRPHQARSGLGCSAGASHPQGPSGGWCDKATALTSRDPGDKNLGDRCQLCELEAQLFEGKARASVKTLELAWQMLREGGIWGQSSNRCQLISGRAFIKGLPVPPRNLPSAMP